MRNQVIRRNSIASIFVAGALAAGTARADPPTPPPPAAHPAVRAPEPPRSVYRFDVTIAGLAPGDHAAPAAYSLMLEEGNGGAVSVGENVPMVAASPAHNALPSPRTDVGLTIRLSYTLQGTAVMLLGDVEFSTLEPNAAGNVGGIHRVRINGVTPVTPGTSATLGTVYDPSSHRTYEVTISAHRLI